MPAASLAPPQSRCAVHPDVAAATICTRCGAFMCGECSRNNQEATCPTCRAHHGFDVEKLARAYRNLVLWFGGELVLALASPMLTSVPLAGLFVNLGLLVTLAMLTIYAYRTAAAMGSTLPVLWAVAMFVPCLNVITLLSLSSKATAACNERGIAVGFLGPKV